MKHFVICAFTLLVTYNNTWTILHYPFLPFFSSSLAFLLLHFFLLNFQFSVNFHFSERDTSKVNENIEMQIRTSLLLRSPDIGAVNLSVRIKDTQSEV